MSSAVSLPRFNPRVREGRDSARIKLTMDDAVSIHASVKDATIGRWLFYAMECFNPRVREGRDR